MSRKVSGISIFAILVVLLPACARAPQPAGPPPALQVGIILPATDNAMGSRLAALFEEGFLAAGMDTPILSSMGDAGREKANVEALVSRGAKVIILSPVDAGVAGPAVEDARAAGVRVIALDTLVRDTSAVDFLVTFDRVSAGRVQARYLVDRAGGRGHPLYIYTGSTADANAYLTFAGAWSELQPRIVDGTFVIQNSPQARGLSATATLTQEELASIFGVAAPGRQVDVAAVAAADLRTAAPEAKGSVFILAVDDPTARAVAGAFTADSAVSSHVLTGQGAEVESVQYILDEVQSMTVLLDERQLVRAAIAAALAFLQGSAPAQTTTFNNGVAEIPAGVLPVVTIDRTNVRSALIDSGYYTADTFQGLP